MWSCCAGVMGLRPRYLRRKGGGLRIDNPLMIKRLLLRRYLIRAGLRLRRMADANAATRLSYAPRGRLQAMCLSPIGEILCALTQIAWFT